MVKPTMYIFANRGLGMSPGKLAAQVAHAACEAMVLSPIGDVDAWRSGGHYTKIILSIDDELQMANVIEYIRERGFKVAPIIDEGRTEIRPFSRTAEGVQIVDKAEQYVIDTFSSFSLYKELPRPIYEDDMEIMYSTVGAHGHLNRKGEREYRRLANK